MISQINTIASKRMTEAGIFPPFPNEVRTKLDSVGKYRNQAPLTALITGDASDRKFYRVTLGNTSAICMNFPQWTGGYGGDPISWLGMHSALEKISLPVPKVFAIDENNCNIWTEDFGDCFLNQTENFSELDIQNPKCTNTITLYKDSISSLVDVQYPLKSIGSHPAQKKFFDSEKLFFEMEFFFTHFVQGFFALPLDHKSSAQIKEELANICRTIAALPKVLCHRDFHVRNIMVQQNQIKWIDFQDARMGPHSYDLLSLVRDAYIPITLGTRNIFTNHYLDTLKVRTQHLNIEFPFEQSEAFQEECLIVGLQRNLKALGSFGYLAKEKNKLSYLSYVKHTLAMIISPEHIKAGSKNLHLEAPCLFDFLKNLNHGELAHHIDEKLSQYAIKNLGLQKSKH